MSKLPESASPFWRFLQASRIVIRRVAFFVIILILLAFASRACEGPTEKERDLQVKYHANQLADELALVYRLAQEAENPEDFEERLRYYAHEVEDVKTVMSPMNNRPFLYNSKPQENEAILLTVWERRGRRQYYAYFPEKRRLLRVDEKRVHSWGTNTFRSFPAVSREERQNNASE